MTADGEIGMTNAKAKSARLVLAALVALAGPALPTQATAAGAEALRVGRTGILCVRLPCPHRGIYRPGAKDMQGLRAALLYADLDGRTGLPSLAGAEADLQAVRDAWARNACIGIVGWLDGAPGAQVLHVERIEGDCP